MRLLLFSDLHFERKALPAKLRGVAWNFNGGGTRVACKPLGYPFHWSERIENGAFKPSLIIEV